MSDAWKWCFENPREAAAEIARLKRCAASAMGCIDPCSQNRDEQLAWYRLLDAIEGREPRDKLDDQP